MADRPTQGERGRDQACQPIRPEGLMIVMQQLCQLLLLQQQELL